MHLSLAITAVCAGVAVAAPQFAPAQNRQQNAQVPRTPPVNSNAQVLSNNARVPINGANTQARPQAGASWPAVASRPQGGLTNVQNSGRIVAQAPRVIAQVPDGVTDPFSDTDPFSEDPTEQFPGASEPGLGGAGATEPSFGGAGASEPFNGAGASESTLNGQGTSGQTSGSPGLGEGVFTNPELPGAATGTDPFGGNTPGPAPASGQNVEQQNFNRQNVNQQNVDQGTGSGVSDTTVPRTNTQNNVPVQDIEDVQELDIVRPEPTNGNQGQPQPQPEIQQTAPSQPSQPRQPGLPQLQPNTQFPAGPVNQGPAPVPGATGSLGQSIGFTYPVRQPARCKLHNACQDQAFAKLNDPSCSPERGCYYQVQAFSDSCLMRRCPLDPPDLKLTFDDVSYVVKLKQAAAGGGSAPALAPAGGLSNTPTGQTISPFGTGQAPPINNNIVSPGAQPFPGTGAQNAFPSTESPASGSNAFPNNQPPASGAGSGTLPNQPANGQAPATNTQPNNVAPVDQSQSGRGVDFTRPNARAPNVGGTLAALQPQQQQQARTQPRPQVQPVARVQPQGQQQQRPQGQQQQQRPQGQQQQRPQAQGQQQRPQAQPQAQQQQRPAANVNAPIQQQIDASLA